MTTWVVMFCTRRNAPNSIECSGDDIERKIHELFPTVAALEIEHATDQIDVYTRRKNGKRRDKFMTLMAD